MSHHELSSAFFSGSSGWLRPCTFLLDVIKDIPMQTSNVEVNDLSGPRTIVVLHDENACGIAAATRDIS